MGVVGGAVVGQGVLHVGQVAGQVVGDGIANRCTIRRFRIVRIVQIGETTHDGLVHTLPVIHILALAPLLLEGLLTLVHGHLVVEVPLSVAACRLWRLALLGVGVGVAVALGATLCQLFLHFFLLGLVALLLLLLLEGFDDAVDGGVAFFLVHLRQQLQRVLQVDGVGVGHQLVEHLRALRQFLVVGAVLVQQADGFAVAALGVVVFLAFPVDVA